jgi:hypothetical protein
MSLLQNISNYLLSAKESPKAERQFLSWNQLSKILIVAYDNQLSGIVDFINICKKDNIKVMVAIIYNGKPEQAPKPHFEFVLLEKKQFSLFQLPTEEAINMLNGPYDAIVNLGNMDQFQALALSKLVPAKLKIAHFQNSIFEIVINGDNTLNTSDYLKQVVVYLNMIKTNNK